MITKSERHAPRLESGLRLIGTSAKGKQVWTCKSGYYASNVINKMRKRREKKARTKPKHKFIPDFAHADETKKDSRKKQSLKSVAMKKQRFLDRAKSYFKKGQR